MSLCRQIATWEGYLTHMSRRMLVRNYSYVTALTAGYNKVAGKHSFSQVTEDDVASALVQGAFLYPTSDDRSHFPMNACRVLYGIDKYETGVGWAIDTAFRQLSDSLAFTTYSKVCALF